MGLLLLEALVAVQVLVVTTILPAIEQDLGGLRLYGWALSASSFAAFAAIPIASRAADRSGPRKLLALTLSVVVGGMAVSALAPSMLVVAVGRFIQGAGAGALYAVSLATVAKTYPSRLRPRVLALLASMWILPGLFGPPLGAICATTVGWRWAFLAPIPILAVAAWLVLPAMGSRSPVDEGIHLPIRGPVQLMFGAGLFLGALTGGRGWTIPLAVLGLLVALPALSGIVPAGTFRARPGLPAAAAGAFLLSVAFYAINGFVPLMLTEVRRLSIGEASIVVTMSTVAWALGSWWQSRKVASSTPGNLVRIGAVLIAVGTLAVAGGMWGIPIWISYAGWGLSGIGMGIAFPTFPLAVMGEAAEGRESRELSATLLMDTLGVAIGAGLGGASIALSQSWGASLRAGLVGTFAVGAVAMVLLFAVAPRLPRGAAASPSR